MSRYFDDELTHSGVKGMKWRKHKYRLVKDANGKLRYVYDNDNTGTGTKSSKAQMFRQARAEEKDKDIGKRSNTGTKPLTETYLVPTKTNNNGLVRTSKLRSTVLTGRSGEQKQREEKREATRDKKVIERMARNERHRQAEANNHKAKATGKRAKWAYDKPYQSKVEYDQAHQSFMLKERDKLRKKGEPSLISSPYNGSASKYHDEVYKDRQRNAKRSMEGFETGLSESHNSPSLAGPGHRARAAESTARHKAAVNAQEKRKKKEEQRARRLRQAEANKEQIENRKKAQRVANNHKAKATGKRASWAEDKPYQSKAEYDQAHQSLMLKARDKLRKQGDHSYVGYKDKDKSVSQMHDELYKTQQRLSRRLNEGFSPDAAGPLSPTLAGWGHRARAAESTARHEAAVKAQKKKKNKVTDTIDKGRKAVEEFFTPKKKKKR